MELVLKQVSIFCQKVTVGSMAMLGACPSSTVTDNLLGHQHPAVEVTDRIRLVQQGQEMTRDAVLPTMEIFAAFQH